GIRCGHVTGVQTCALPICSKYPLGMHLYQGAPFFALNNPAMNGFVTKYHDRYGEFPSDWAVMDYDAMTMYAKAANAAGSFDADRSEERRVGKERRARRAAE